MSEDAWKSTVIAILVLLAAFGIGALYLETCV